MTKETGGSAFPIPNLEDYPEFNGMSLRDWFADQALSGFIAAHTELIGHGTYISSTDAARHSYEYADAMLEVRGAK